MGFSVASAEQGLRLEIGASGSFDIEVNGTRLALARHPDDSQRFTVRVPPEVAGEYGSGRVVMTFVTTASTRLLDLGVTLGHRSGA